jgi:hypothetical protein
MFGLFKKSTSAENELIRVTVEKYISELVKEPISAAMSKYAEEIVALRELPSGELLDAAKPVVVKVVIISLQKAAGLAELLNDPSEPWHTEGVVGTAPAA